LDAVPNFLERETLEEFPIAKYSLQFPATLFLPTHLIVGRVDRSLSQQLEKPFV
jgi:hypothetical protein